MRWSVQGAAGDSAEASWDGFEDSPGEVITGQCARASVVAVFESRREREIIVNPEDVVICALACPVSQ
jgi:hypothetical protein